MSEQTKGKIRAVLEEHLGPAAVKDIGDRDSLRASAKAIEWGNVTIALETEFDIALSDLVVEKADTIDQIAALIDTIVSSKLARPH